MLVDQAKATNEPRFTDVVLFLFSWTQGLVYRQIAIREGRLTLWPINEQPSSRMTDEQKYTSCHNQNAADEFPVRGH